MLSRLILIFIFTNITQFLLAQGLDEPMVIQEEIYFESLSDSKSTLFHLLIDPIQDKQDIHYRAYSEQPDSVVLRQQKYFAVWNRTPNQKPIELKITTVIEKFGPRRTVSYQKEEKDTYVETEGKTFTQKVNISNKSLRDLAEEKYRNQESNDAIIIYDMLIKQDPKNYGSYLFKGVSLARIGEYDEAMFQLETAEQFIEKEFEIAYVTYAKANVYALMGDKEQCITALHEAIKQGFRNFSNLSNDPDFKDILTRQEIDIIIYSARE